MSDTHDGKKAKKEAADEGGIKQARADEPLEAKAPDSKKKKKQEENVSTRKANTKSSWDRFEAGKAVDFQVRDGSLLTSYFIVVLS
ncbi:hypothetical protein BgiBS90_009546 [Biomphalaria glabrata]|nr:hypothetical protein BgiBS90_009546 [Biomphalaria glabrata]